MLTIILIAATALISIAAFNNQALLNNYLFYPPAVKKGQWYRLITYGFLHADYMHLIFNMFTLYFFGMDIEKVCKEALGNVGGSVCYLLLYFSALVVSILPSYFKHKDNENYRSLGASGAVSAVIFAYVLVNPMNFMGIMFIPVWLPAFLFGIIFILISTHLGRKQSKGINHTAHVAGALYGVIFMVVAFFAMAQINLLEHFVNQIHVSSVRDIIRFGI